MKKLLCAIMATIMVIGAFGCTGPAASNPPASQSAEASQPATTATTAPTPASTPQPVQQTPTPTQEGDQLADEQILNFSMTVDAPTLDQNKASSAASSTVARGIYEGLVRLKNGNEVIPGVAETWDISPDGKTYTFHLRKDAKWSDGSTITANDFVYSFKRLLDPATASSYAFLGYIMKNGLDINSGKLGVDELGVTAKDDYTLEIQIEYPAPYFFSMLHMMQLNPVKEAFVKEQGEKYAQETSNLLYNGPFVLKEWKHEEYLLLEKNENYWDKDNITLTQVKINVIKSGTEVALDKFNAGELDIVDIPAMSFERYKDNPEVKYVSYGAIDWLSMKMDNPDTPWLSNKNFRIAMNYAVDREDYCILATKGLYEAGTRLVLPDVMGVAKPYFEEYNIASFPTKADPAKAQEYLAKAMEELKIANASDIQVTLITSDDDNSKLQAEVLQQMFEENLGIKFNIQPVTYAQKLENDHKSTYELVFKGWMPDYDDPMTYMELFQTGNGEATCHWNNADFDALIEKARYEADPKTRMDYFAQAEQLMYDDACAIPLQVRRRPYMVSEKLKGYSRSFMVDLDYIYAYFIK